jgi:2,4-dienoyl-CoA reductase-like NADH-dependent reductase (Old Yellow Enzyme family)
MATHERFRFRSIDELRAKIDDLGVSIRLEQDLSPLVQPVAIGPLQTPNSLGIHPMEGCDGKADGSPDALTIRRYERFAAGGAGLLWFEATAVVPQGRANPRQLWIHRENVGEFATLVKRVEQIGREQFGPNHQSVRILQLTHSGRYSRPVDLPAPVIAFHHPVLDPRAGLAADYPTITDDELERLEDRYVEAAKLAREAGFHGVDIKATHGYLVAELLAGHTRPGRYGGSLENRTRFLLNVVEKVRATVPDLLVAVRLWACDGMQYPFSWGMSREVPGREDMAEPIRLVKLLHQKGVSLLNSTAGNPYYNAHVARPFDQNIRGAPMEPDEHPLEGIDRLFRTARAIQQAVPEMVVVNTGYSWLRQFFPYAAAANLQHGWARIAGLGRMAFAYPDFARDLLDRGSLDPKRVCTACSKCTQLMRDKTVTGCVTRDAAVYLPIYTGHHRHR